MKYFSKVLKFIYQNRRPIGLLVGSALAVFGYPEEGEAVKDFGKLL